MSVSSTNNFLPSFAHQLSAAGLCDFSDLKNLSLALRIQNGIISPPNAPRIWSKQIKRIDKFYVQHDHIRYPITKDKLIESLKKTEKFKREHLGKILKIKQLPDDKRKVLIGSFQNEDMRELVQNLIYQPFPEEPIEHLIQKGEEDWEKGEEDWESKESSQSSDKTPGFFFSLLNKIAAISICAGLVFSKKAVQEQKRNWRTNFEMLASQADNTIGQQQLYLENYELHPIEITSPDKNKIRGTYFKNKNSAALGYLRPKIITCNPSGGLFMNYTWMLHPSIASNGYDIINFDYRGCGDSDGFPSALNDLYLDAKCVYQFVKNCLHSNPSKIHFYGHSLGGNVCANVKAAFPECDGRMVIDRSFSQLKNVISNYFELLTQIIVQLPELVARHIFDFPKSLIPAAILFAIIVSFFAPIVSSFESIAILLPPKASFFAPAVARIVSFLNWEAKKQDAAKDATGRNLLVYHDNDKLMKDDAGLKNIKNFDYLDLTEYSIKPLTHIHSTPLDYFVCNNNVQASLEVSNFLLGIKAPKKSL